VRTAVARIDGADVRLVGRDARATPQSGPDAVVAALVASARAACDAAGIPIGDIAAAGLASPGPLDHTTGVILTTQNIAGFVDSNFPIAELAFHSRLLPEHDVGRATAHREDMQ